MRLPCWLIFVITLNGLQFTIGISNDIVSSLRCKLLCKDADAFSYDLSEENVCKCKLRNKLTEQRLMKIQDLSTLYKLPLVLEHVHIANKVKRQAENVLDDLRDKMDEKKQQWDSNFEKFKTWHERQAEELEPLLGQLPKWEDHQQQLDEHLENFKMWQEDQAQGIEPLLGQIAPTLEEHKEKLEEHLENLRTWHEREVEPLLGGIDLSSLDEHKQQLDDHLDNLRSWQEDQAKSIEPILEKIAPKLEEHKQQLDEHLENIKSWHENAVEPLLGGLYLKPFRKNQENPKWEEHKQQWQNKQFKNVMAQNEPILGQMAPSLTTYDSQATGVGGSNVNFPKPNHPNPFIPPLAHIIDAIPFPRFNIPVGATAPAQPARPSSAIHFPIPRMPLFTPRFHPGNALNPAAALPSKFDKPYNPINPIVVQPIVIPQPEYQPKPILHSLRDSVDDMLKNMKKNGGRLVPENYLNSDALSNSESQVNQINVNVRVEPTPTPPNLFSFFLPYNRNWLAAPAPKNIGKDDVTDNPGRAEEPEEEDEEEEDEGKKQRKQQKPNKPNKDYEDEEDVEDEEHMQEQLSDVDKSNKNAHVVDSVKKNLPSKTATYDADDEKYSKGIIVQPKQYMDTEEDLETLAK